VGGKEVLEGVPIPTTVQPSSSAAVKCRQYSSKIKRNYFKILKNYFLTKESLKDMYSGGVHIILNKFFAV
jgi:hypothetical protein